MKLQRVNTILSGIKINKKTKDFEPGDILDEDKINFVEEDVYAKREYLDAYWDKIPVILYKDKVLMWPFTGENVKEFTL